MVEVVRPEATYIPSGLAPYGNTAQAVVCVCSSPSSFELWIWQGVKNY